MTVSSIELTATGLVVPLASGPAYFNNCWLREACPSCIDAQTQERIFDVSALPDIPRAVAARIEGEELVIDWQAEEHVSRIPLARLEAVYAAGASAIRPICRAACGIPTRAAR